MQEQKFNNSEIRDKYKELFENSLDLIYIHDLRGNFIDANDIALIFLGYNRDELHEISFKNLIDKRQLAIVFKALKEIKENGKQLRTSKYKLKTKNGDIKFVETYGIPLKKNGEIYGILGIAKDVTEKIKIFQKLEDSKRKLNELNIELEQKVNERTLQLKKSEDSLRERVKELSCLYELSKLAENQNFSNIDIIRGALKLIPAAWQFPELTCARIIFNNKEYLTHNFKKTEWKLSSKIKINEKLMEIEILYLEERNFLEEEKNLINHIGFRLKSILEHKIADQKLKESEVKFRLLFEKTNDLIIVQNEKFEYEFMNEQVFKNILGYSNDDILGKTNVDLVHQDDIKGATIAASRILRKGKGSHQLRFRHKNGNYVWLEAIGHVFFDSKGEKKIITILRDITEKKKEEIYRESFKEQLEKEVNLRTKELNYALEQQKLFLDQIVRASQFKTEFLATMSHELRTPLNAIIGFTDLLLEGGYGPLNEEQMDFLTDIKSSAEHQLDMIKNILDISKIESGQLHLNWQRFSLNIIIDQANATVKPLYDKKKLNFMVQGLDYERFIYADPIRFKEILLNLLSNAVKFTMSGGITLIVQENARNWIFKVKDTGIGIARKDFNIIFKEFKRVDSPFVESVPGTGLGLSLTKRLVDLHGGEITFSSKLGEGTTFTFTIPKIEDK